MSVDAEEPLLHLERLHHASEVRHAALGLEPAFLHKLPPGLQMPFHEAFAHNQLRKSAPWVLSTGFPIRMSVLNHLPPLCIASNIVHDVCLPLLLEPLDVADVILQA